MSTNKKIGLLLTLILGLIAIPFWSSAQPIQKLRTPLELKKFYDARESQAPANVKTELNTLRTRIINNKLTFTVGYTGASSRSLSVLASEKEMSAADVNAIKSRMVGMKTTFGEFDAAESYSGAIPTRFDARDRKWISAVRDQGNCGSCWAFGAVAMYEANYRVRNSSIAEFINASEQQVMDCVDGGCGGGFAYRVFDWMLAQNKNLKTEAQYPYVAVEKACPATPTNTNYYAEFWRVLRPDGDINKIADKALIKEAIMTYGAVNSSLYVTSEWPHYTGVDANGNPGVLNGMVSNPNAPTSNHAILIIGWDDSKQAFLVKNSWGTDWGMDGFCWVKYDHYNIGRRAAIIVAKRPAAYCNKITIENKASYLAEFTVKYNDKGVDRTYSSGPFGMDKAKTFEVPCGATNLVLTVKLSSGRVIVTKPYPSPVNVCYSLRGDTANPRFEPCSRPL